MKVLTNYELYKVTMQLIERLREFDDPEYSKEADRLEERAEDAINYDLRPNADEEDHAQARDDLLEAFTKVRIALARCHLQNKSFAVI